MQRNEQVEAFHKHQATSSDFVSLARPSDDGLEFAPLTNFASFFANTPAASVSHTLRYARNH